MSLIRELMHNARAHLNEWARAVHPVLIASLNDKVQKMIIAAVGAAAKGATVQKVSEGIQGLVGDTATDKRRKAEAEQLLRAALEGDVAALRQLAFNAFEQRRGMPGDNRTPIDGKMSPRDVRDLARKALQQYAATAGGVPPEIAQYAGQIGAPVTDRSASLIEQITRPAVDSLASAAVDAAEQRARERAAAASRSAMPWLIGAAIVVGAFLLLRK